jgi:cytosine/uracil/thiamine/allantoin permease
MSEVFAASSPAPPDAGEGAPSGGGPSGSLTNADLAPTTPEQRTWNVWHIASLWIGMSVCIPRTCWRRG